MAYRLKLGESVPEGIRRVVCEEIEYAADQLSGKGEAERDEAIHEARKSVKKIRGVLRLVEPELGKIFKIENARFRSVGQKLSEFRDAGAIIETFDTLTKKYAEDMGKRSLDSIRRGLIARKEQAEKKAKIEQVLRRLAAALRREARAIKTWPLETDGFPAIAPGLEQTFRRGRRAMALVRKRPHSENYHDWRKRVKDHWYHIRLLENLWTEVMTAYEKSLKELETWLGEDHNLVVLREKVLAEPAFYGKEKDIDFFVHLLDRYHKELRDNAQSVGERIYEEKPRHFTSHMQHLWDAWQSQPKTLEAVETHQPGTAA